MATKKSSSSGQKLTLNKFSFWCIVSVAFLYLLSLVLSVCGVNFKIVAALQGVATACIVVIVSILAWRYVRPREFVWKLLYVLCLLAVIAGIIVPLIK